MSGSRHSPYRADQGFNTNPRLVDRTPQIEEREPRAELRPDRSSSETRRPHSLTLFSFTNPLTGTSHNRFLVTERSRPRAGGDRESIPTFLRAPDYIGHRSSSPPPPPLLITQERTRSLSPFRRLTMSPKPGGEQGGYVPLPPRIETIDLVEQARQDRSRGDSGSRNRERHHEREPRQPRNPQEELIQLAEAQPPTIIDRAPRRYRHSRQVSVTHPSESQEQILEPGSSSSVLSSALSSSRPRSSERFEIIQPSDSIRARQRASGAGGSLDVRSSREYRELREIAEHNYQAAQEAAQRCASAEVRLQNLRRELADMEVRENRSIEVQDDLRQEVETLRAELESLRREARGSRDTRADRDEGRETSGSGNGGSTSAPRQRRRRQHRYSVEISQDQQPRTPDPRSGSGNAGGAAATTTGTEAAGMSAIEQARAEARGGRIR